VIGRGKLLTLLSLLKVKWQTNTRMENDQTVNFVERMVQVASTMVKRIFRDPYKEAYLTHSSEIQKAYQ